MPFSPAFDVTIKRYGLIGYPLTHSFSRNYFSQKFNAEGIDDCQYDLFELPDISGLPALIRSVDNLRGLNVTIPHKQAVIPFLDELDADSAKRIGAVNTIRFLPDGRTVGYNTDYYGFRTSLVDWLTRHQTEPASLKALVLGNGGAAKAVFAALTDLGIAYRIVSRTQTDQTIIYDRLDQSILSEYRLIINTSPLGTYPDVDNCPSIPYAYLSDRHFLYDLVYNPAETLFMKQGSERGSATLNGLPMLIGQAEKAWEIWNL